MNAHLKYPLTAAAIDEISEKVDAYLSELKMENKNRLRIRLSMEEVLLNWREAFGDEAVCTLKTGIRFGRPYLALELPGKSVDPWNAKMTPRTGAGACCATSACARCIPMKTAKTSYC